MTDDQNRELFCPEVIESIILVHSVFNDIRKTSQWFCCPNPFFGGVSPVKMIMCGRVHKILKFIKAQADENGMGKV